MGTEQQKYSTEKLLVSVVIPVYNGERYIEECLHSVYQQSYRPIEVIVVDDGSTDSSLKIIREAPGEKKIISQQNKDVSHARNTGVQNSSGEFVAFLDQDDLWHPEKLEKQVQAFKDNPDVDLVFTDLIKFNDEGKTRHARDRHRYASKLNDPNLFVKLLRKNVLMPSAVMVKKDSFIKAGMFDARFKTCGDYEMWLRMAARGMKFRYLPEPLTLYRQHGENTSKQIEIMNEDRLKAVRKIFSLGELSASQKKLEKIALASVYMESAHAFFSIKEYERFLQDAKEAISHSKQMVNWKFLRRYIRAVVSSLFG